ncbi:uncharacterized protein LOC128998925 [Macrosteles quadrilineatus]|uniref:uncharacterized protein LOC128998925 n=1 Tax=Macrosteles quadrilineatus TaxID=74068 RepID=UPI0023E2133B|nr:uncharacterized protein LOC128998925 [Macrosteles quadrilineatus]
MKLLQFICTFLILPLISHQQFPFSLSRQFIIFDEVHQCANQGTKDVVWDLRLNRVSRKNLVLQGNVTLNLPMDEKVSALVSVSEKSNGNWIEQAFLFKFINVCQDMMLSVPSIWISFWEKAGISPPVTCPIPKGKHHLKNYSTTEGLQQVPGIKQGKFKATVEFLHRNKTRLGCVVFILHTSTKKQ